MLSLAACGEKDTVKDEGQASTAFDSEAYLKHAADEMTDNLTAIASDKAFVELLGGGAGIEDVVEGWSKLRPDKTKKVIVLKPSAEALLAIASAQSSEETLSEQAKAYMTVRMGGSVANILNGMYGGVSVIAAASVVSYSRTYVPEGPVENQVWFIPCDEDVYMTVSFVNSGDGAVTAMATFTVMPESSNIVSIFGGLALTGSGLENIEW